MLILRRVMSTPPMSSISKYIVSPSAPPPNITLKSSSQKKLSLPNTQEVTPLSPPLNRKRAVSFTTLKPMPSQDPKSPAHGPQSAVVAELKSKIKLKLDRIEKPNDDIPLPQLSPISCLSPLSPRKKLLPSTFLSISLT